MDSDYKFYDPENTACFVCIHVFDKRSPILHVSHDEDGYWQFLCGQNGHSDSEAKIISLKEATKIDDSINELYELPLGFSAYRNSINEKWIISEILE